MADRGMICLWLLKKKELMGKMLYGQIAHKKIWNQFFISIIIESDFAVRNDV